MHSNWLADGTRSRLPAVVLLALLVLAALLAVGCGSSEPSGDGGGVTYIPADEFSVADYAGKPLVVNFFGSWCPPCNLEAPDLAAFAADNPDVQFVGVAVDDNEADLAEFMAKYGLDYPVVMTDWGFAGEYGVSGVPTTVFYDAAGQEKDRIVGAASSEQFAQSLAAAS
jgi:thiol-disulfide isomerase/thioredoxin